MSELSKGDLELIDMISESRFSQEVIKKIVEYLDVYSVKLKDGSFCKIDSCLTGCELEFSFFNVNVMKRKHIKCLDIGRRDLLIKFFVRFKTNLLPQFIGASKVVKEINETHQLINNGLVFILFQKDYEEMTIIQKLSDELNEVTKIFKSIQMHQKAKLLKKFQEATGLSDDTVERCKWMIMDKFKNFFGDGELIDQAKFEKFCQELKLVDLKDSLDKVKDFSSRVEKQ